MRAVKASAGIFSLDADGKDPRRRLRLGKFDAKRRQREAIDGRSFAGYAVVIHGIDAVGRNVHFEKRAVAWAEWIDAVDGDTAQGQVLC